MQIRRRSQPSAEATWIPDAQQQAALPAGLREGLGAKPEEVCRLQTLGLLRQPAVVRPAAGGTDALALRRRYGRVGLLCSADERIALSCDPAWTPGMLRQVLVGLQQGLYRFERYKTRPQGGCQRLDLLGLQPAQRPGLEEAVVLGEALSLCRDLINTPAEDLGPAAFVRNARRLCRGTGLRLRLLDAAACAKAGMGCLCAVGRAAREPARLLILEWPGHKRSNSFEALCGKGVCFDTGGLNLKPDKSMALMRKDMGGAATVLAAMLACARLGARGALRAYLPLVENAIGPGAFRPGDVLRALDGTTVEVGNTDAEGRLILADAIALARREGARSITTVATLTGAALVALGRIHVPLMGDDAPVQALLDAALASGEKCWRLPLDAEHAAIMRGEMADLRNDGNGEAGCITAGAFLRHFAGDTPFVHCDISPTSWQEKAHDLGPAGATGVLVSSLVARHCSLSA